MSNYWNPTLIIFLLVVILLIVLFYLLFNYDEDQIRGGKCSADHHCLPGLFCSKQDNSGGKCAYNIDCGLTEIGLPCYALNECPDNGYCSSNNHCLLGQGRQKGQKCTYNSDCQLGLHCDCRGYCARDNIELITNNFTNYLIINHHIALYISYNLQDKSIYIEKSSTDPKTKTNYDGAKKQLSAISLNNNQYYWHINNNNVAVLTKNIEEASVIFLHKIDKESSKFCLVDIYGHRAYYNKNNIKFLEEDVINYNLILTEQTSLYC